MTGTITLDGELELEETTDADGNKAWRIVDANGNRRKLILGEAEADVVDGEELSVTEGGTPALTQQVVYRAEDTDTSTALSIDTGTLPESDRFVVRGVVAGHAGTGAYDTLSITVNNKTDSYYYQSLNQGTATYTTNAAAWTDEMYNQYHLSMDYRIFGGASQAAQNNDPTISGQSSAHGSHSRLQDGFLNQVDNLPVSSIQLSTPFNATATVVIMGVTY